MNDKKYLDQHYKFRKITDLKDLIVSSAELFSDHAAYLEKNKETDKFEEITYGQVLSDMNAFGTKLIDMGLKGKKIAVIGETSYKWLLTYFTVVSGVGVIVPLDKNLPSGELVGLVERSGASAIVYSDKSKEAIEELKKKPGAIEFFIPMKDAASDAEVNGAADIEVDGAADASVSTLIEQGEALLAEGETSYIDSDVDPDEMCTLLFTSGTTGMAKGVMISHRNIASNCYAMSKFFKIPEPGIVLSILPIHHVYEMTCDIFTTFYQGKTIAICEGIKYIQKNMVEVKANVMLGVPLVFEKMYKGMWKQARRRGEEKKLRRAIDISKRLKLYNNRLVITRLFKAIHDSFGGAMQAFVVGGAKADPFIKEEFEAMGLPMIEGYGMSENSPIICLNPDRYRKFDSVGTPLPGTKVRIVDQDEDGIGEIIVKGPSVMLGYYENEEATAEALQNGWLHTGDLGYLDGENFLHITGRAKTVIVTKGGKNIFPEEVEAVIQENEFVEEVVVHGVTDDRVGNVMITADIYPNYEKLKKKKMPLGESEVYHFFRDTMSELNKTLPPYKQVKRVNIRKEPFIKTTTGKIKRFGNKLSGEDKYSGSMDAHDKKRMEESMARELVDQIRMSSDALIASKDIRPVTDVKALIGTSADRFEGNTAFIRKIEGDVKDRYRRLTYKQMLSDMDGLGTSFLNRDLGGSKVALIGSNGYKWQISFLAVICGVGTCVPIESDLDKDEMERRLIESGAEVAIFEEKFRDVLCGIRKAGKTELKTLIEYSYTESGLDDGESEDIPDDPEAPDEAGDTSVPKTVFAAKMTSTVDYEARAAEDDAKKEEKAGREAKKAAKEEEKARKKAAKDKEKALKKAAKEEEKAEKKEKKASRKATKKVAKEVKKAAKEAEKAAKKAAKKVGGKAAGKAAGKGGFDEVLLWDDLIEEGKNQVAQGDRQYIDRTITGDDVAVIVYTSGATGEASAVSLTHTNITYGVMQAAASIRIDPSDTVYSALPAHVMYEITCGLLLPLYRGATIITTRRGAYTGAGDIEEAALATTASASVMCEEMKDTKPTVLVLTAKDIRILQKLFEDTVEERRGSNAIYKLMDASKYTRKVGVNILKPFARSVRALVGGKLRMMITGGSRVSKDTMEYMRAFGVTALQSYWLTECATVAAVDPEDRKLVRFGSCGHLVPGMEVKVINKGRDGIGEICLKGANVMKDVDDGWLHTGDAGFIDEDNYIYITGRVSDQVDD